MYFKFSRLVKGPFADPFVDHLTIFVLKTHGSSVIFCPSCLCFLGLATCHVMWLSFHYAMPCLQVKRPLRRRCHREVVVSHRAQSPSAQCRKVDFWQPSKRCQERQLVSGSSRSQITTRVTRKFSSMLGCGVYGYFDVHHQQGTCVHHQSYARSLWRARQLFVQICGVAGGQTKALARV